jgi:hypothetical protein
MTMNLLHHLRSRMNYIVVHILREVVQRAKSSPKVKTCRWRYVLKSVTWQNVVNFFLWVPVRWHMAIFKWAIRCNCSSGVDSKPSKVGIYQFYFEGWRRLTLERWSAYCSHPNTILNATTCVVNHSVLCPGRPRSQSSYQNFNSITSNSTRRKCESS